MKLSVTAWSFPALTLAECAAVARAIGIAALDVGLSHASALERGRVLADSLGYAAELADLKIALSNCYWLFGAGVAERNLADPASRAANTAEFAAVARFCQAAKIPSVMLLPGIVNPGQRREDALAESATSLRALLPIAAEHGIILGVEPHIQSFAESPATTLALLAAVPGLKLVLDYAHFVCLGYQQEAIDVLAPHAAHIHIRQARPGALQAKLALGTINFAALIGTLRAADYGGYLAIEYVFQDYMDTLHDDVLTETVRTRDLLRRFL